LNLGFLILPKQVTKDYHSKKKTRNLCLNLNTETVFNEFKHIKGENTVGYLNSCVSEFIPIT
jgi:hypothetical protein